LSAAAAGADIAAALARWKAHIAAPDPATLWEMLHPDAVFESPVVHTPQRGRDITFKYLASADQVLGGPDFAYRGEWTSDTGAILEFSTVIDGIAINGIDMITWGGDGRIVHFKVMVRPLKAVNLVHERMAAMLGKAGSLPG
jgi:hypothetical protein